jgi:hypothetical protein
MVYDGNTMEINEWWWKEIRTDGASFPAIPRLRRFAASTVIVMGIASLGTPDLSGFEHRTIMLPSVPHGDEEMTPAEEYLKLRADIVAAGIAMLSDDELREEIRDRRRPRRAAFTGSCPS